MWRATGNRLRILVGGILLHTTAGLFSLMKMLFILFIRVVKINYAGLKLLMLRLIFYKVKIFLHY
jgi:hypothetical protein